MNNRELGKLGEDMACRVLENRGYRIVDRNYRCSVGEIDIIARKNGKWCFIEVKTRNGSDYGRPCEAVDVRKQQRIKNIAVHYIKQRKPEKQKFKGMEFQVFEVIFEHIENAF